MNEPKDFVILSEIRRTEIIASGRGVRIRRYLNSKYRPAKWRKMKGVARVEEPDGSIYEAEIHWYEAHGVGRVDWKIKQPYFG